MDGRRRSSSSSPAPPLRIVICPWLGFGHMLPYLELAERLASRGHRVSYVSTQRNLARLPPLRRHAGAGAVDLVPLRLPRVQGLPDGAESTNDVPGDGMETLWDAFDGLAAPFAEFLRAACAADGGDRRPDWVLADTFHHWAAAAAAEHGVPCAMLLPTAAMIADLACGAREQAELAAAAGGSVFEQPLAVLGAALPRYEVEGHAPAMLTACGASGLSIARRISLTLERCAFTAMRSCPEWELEAFTLAAKLLGKPLVPLGLLPPSPDGGRGAAVHGRDDATVRWLDAQPPGSVVYVALGSEVPLPVELVHEMAHGLEHAGTRFLWALRKPGGVGGSDDDAGVLPAGFVERNQGHGLIAMGWVPQVTILSHAAVQWVPS